MSIEIRAERQTDRDAVFELNGSAFPTDAEAKLVNALRDAAEPYISLVATDGRRIVGHIMFTPVNLGTHDELKIMGLAPMAVSPGQQKSGIGTRLVEAGLAACRDLEIGAVVVLGHANYYPRFGFRLASEWGIGCEYDGPDDAFMALELIVGYLAGCRETIRYNRVFAEDT